MTRELRLMFDFENTYADLPEGFYERVKPSLVGCPSLIKFNEDLARELGLPELSLESITKIFSGNEIPKGAEPLAQAYAGHQFGNFVSRLGDGRAILLGEVIDINGKRRDIQLKGSGVTPFSRSGDGRAWLGPVIREYIVSEAMYALGVPTTRSLAAVLTGEDIYRDSKLPGAVLTRVASSHIRIGTFEYFAARRDTEILRVLADYVIARHYPEIVVKENRYAELLKAVLERQSSLVVQWMSFGFIHGVMNTDNVSISGETLDYGPCAFMDVYHPDTVFSSIDRYGRYAYQNQATICQWNLSCLAIALLPLIDMDSKKAIEICSKVLDSFKDKFEEKFTSAFLKKIGIEHGSNQDYQLVKDLLDLMQKYRADFTLSFRYLSDLISENSDSSRFFALFDEGSNSELSLWIKKWRERINENDPKLISNNMKQVNPLFIPRNHRVEEVIKEAYFNSDYSYMEKLLDILSRPYEQQQDSLEYCYPPEDKDQNYVTFCGT